MTARVYRSTHTVRAEVWEGLHQHHVLGANVVHPWPVESHNAEAPCMRCGHDLRKHGVIVEGERRSMLHPGHWVTGDEYGIYSTFAPDLFGEFYEAVDQ